MGNASKLSVSETLLAQIRHHAEATYPHECCGALLGRDAEPESTQPVGERRAQASREVLRIFPMDNRNGDSPRNRFMVTGEDVRVAEAEAAQHGLEIVGWYHSHPDHPARPSEFDRDHAWPWYSYIIVSVRQRTAKELTAWRLGDDRQAFSEEGIEIRQHAAI
ncbi:MAG TPA: M67 family metallopeptidase [Candidatus Acidoferrum sp.]|nr:M67 family metallopeptidase [Candidatus Acidoferrum sp.]